MNRHERRRQAVTDSLAHAIVQSPERVRARAHAAFDDFERGLPEAAAAFLDEDPAAALARLLLAIDEEADALGRLYGQDFGELHRGIAAEVFKARFADMVARRPAKPPLDNTFGAAAAART